MEEEEEMERDTCAALVDFLSVKPVSNARMGILLATLDTLHFRRGARVSFGQCEKHL